MDMEPMEPMKGKIRLKIKAIPNAKKTEAAGVRDGSLVVKLSAPPDKGRANRLLVEFFSEKLGIRKSAVAIESGETSRNKILAFPKEAEEALASFIASLR